jgi:hypothetical protein
MFNHPYKKQERRLGYLIIEKIGPNVGITISNGVVIGANMVVTKDVPENCLFVGNLGEVKKHSVI